MFLFSSFMFFSSSKSENKRAEQVLQEEGRDLALVVGGRW
jgi:hypothetical protein